MRGEFLLFHEGPSRILISTDQPEAVEAIARKHAVEAPRIGVTIEGRLVIRNRGTVLVDREIGRLKRSLGGRAREDVAGLRAMLDKLHEECGVFAIYGHPEAANLTYLGLYALQHRGQESAGIASSDGARDPLPQGHGARGRHLHAGGARHASGAPGHRAHALLDGRRHRAPERPAVLGGLQQGPHRGGAQRQHHQRRRPAARAGAAAAPSSSPPATRR